MSEPWIESQLATHLHPVTAPEHLWRNIETPRPRPQRRALYAVAATLLVTVSASAVFYAEGSAQRRRDPRVLERFRNAQPLVCSHCHL